MLGRGGGEGVSAGDGEEEEGEVGGREGVTNVGHGGLGRSNTCKQVGRGD